MPIEADSPLTIYPNTKLAFSVPNQLFKMICGGISEIIDRVGPANHS